MDISIIICTKNRAAFLAETLDSLKNARSSGLLVECIVVDNGSTDETKTVVQSRIKSFAWPLRYEYMAKGAKAAGLNHGLAVSTGEAIAFTDDDIRFSDGWLQALTAPLRSGLFEAVIGEIRIAPHLQRGWMKKQHRQMLAEVVRPQPGEVTGLVGANMAFLRRCLDKVPGFDAELGPGALGLGEEGLLGNQLQLAGGRIGFADGAAVEHHFDEKRLLYGAWLKHAQAFGRSSAYVFHHWNHSQLPWRALRMARKSVQYAFWKSTHSFAKKPNEEGIMEEELGLVNNLAFLRQLHIEQSRPRNYDRRGLRKMNYVGR